MATTAFKSASALTVKRWSKKCHKESLKKTYFGKFMGTDDGSMIQVLTDLKKDQGDRIRVQLNTLLTGRGVTGDNVLKGREESLTFYTDDIEIDQLRHAVDIGGRMSRQRTLMPLRKIAMENASKWMAQRYDRALFLQAAGLTTDTDISEQGELYNPGDTAFTGNNATAAPTRHFFTTGANDQALGASNIMTLAQIDDLVTEAKLATPQIKPIMVGGNDFYVMFLHPDQVTDLRNGSTAAGSWFDIQKAALSGGDIADNPIFTGALGVYNNVVLHESSRVPQGQNSSTGAFIPTVRRAIFCGAQAFGLAFGSGDGETSMNWAEEEDDYGNMIGIGFGSIYGLKKLTYNSNDFGVQVLSTYAA